MKISLCLIVKNEEKTIEKCIRSVKEIVSEIILVDTGSNDRTIEIGKNLGARIFNYKWIDDFASARNYTLSKAKGEWIIFLDADEYFDDKSIKLIKESIKKANSLSYDAIINSLININEDTGELMSTTSSIRIFKNDSFIKYKGKIHEIIYNFKRKLKIMNVGDEIKIFHTGYTPSMSKEKNKYDRNVKMLKEQLRNKETSNTYFYLVESLGLNKNVDNEEILEYCNKVFECNNGKMIGIYEKTYFHKLRAIVELNKPEEEIIGVYKEAIEYFDFYPDYEFMIGIWYKSKKKYLEAIEHFQNCIRKMNNYNSNIESWVTSKPKDVFMVLANTYKIVENQSKYIETLVTILNVYKEDELLLIKLITSLRTNSSVKEICELLIKIYNIEDERDKVIILRACKKVGSKALSQYILSVINNQECNCELQDLKEKLINKINKCFQEKNIEEAKKIISEFKEIISNDEDMISIEAMVFFYEEDYEKALQILERAIEENIESFDIIYNAAYINEVMERREEALKYYIKAKEKIDNDNSFIENINKKIEVLQKKQNNNIKIDKMLLVVIEGIKTISKNKNKIEKKEVQSIIERGKESIRFIAEFWKENNISCKDILLLLEKIEFQIGNIIKSNQVEIESIIIDIEYLRYYSQNYKIENYLIEKSNINNITTKKKILFIPYKASMWDSMDSIYNEIKKDSKYEVYVVPAPYNLISNGEISEFEYEGQKISEEVEIIHWQNKLIYNTTFDAIYFHNPYDEYNTISRIHPNFRSEKLRKMTNKLVFTPYAVGIDSFNTVEESKNIFMVKMSRMPALIRANYILSNSKCEKDFLIRNGIESEKIILAAPKLDYIMKNTTSNNIPEEWKRKISNKKVFLLGLTIEYIHTAYKLAIDIINKLIVDNECVLIFRPHPFLINYLKNINMQWANELEKIIKWLKRLPNVIYDDTESYLPAFEASDAFFNDSSSIMPMYILTEKPVYQYIEPQLDKKYHIIDYTATYSKSNGQQVQDFIKLVKEKNDFNKNERVDRLYESIQQKRDEYIDSGYKVHSIVMGEIENF